MCYKRSGTWTSRMGYAGGVWSPPKLDMDNCTMVTTHSHLLTDNCCALAKTTPKEHRPNNTSYLWNQDSQYSTSLHTCSNCSPKPSGIPKTTKMRYPLKAKPTMLEPLQKSYPIHYPKRMMPCHMHACHTRFIIRGGDCLFFRNVSCGIYEGQTNVCNFTSMWRRMHLEQLFRQQFHSLDIVMRGQCESTCNIFWRIARCSGDSPFVM